MADTGWKSPTTATGQWTNNNNALSEDGNFATLEAVGSSGIEVIPWTDETTSVVGEFLNNWGESNALLTNNNGKENNRIYKCNCLI